MDDMRELAVNQIAEAERLLEHLSAFVEAETTEGIALLLIGTEFRLGQAQADSWAVYQSMKTREARVEATALRQADEEGTLDGRNADERKRNESYVKDTNQDVLNAKSDTITARNMHDCVANAHVTVNKALTLVMGMVGGHEDTQ